MGNNSNDSGKPHKTVTLVLNEKRFEVEKQKLIDKSQYFAALLSANYLEHGQTEHVIQYDISLILLQDFIDWIHNDKIAFTSAASHDFEEIDRLLKLLELSVLFAADKLIDNITDKLNRHFMSPKYAIKIWLLAQELNINVLRDLFLAFCLDRFDELSLNSIYELSRENFLKLIGNINLRASKSYLLDIAHEWMNHHHDFTIPLDMIAKKEAKILHSIISCEQNNDEQFIHCWDGNDFFELTSFEYPADIIENCRTGRSLEGMQIIAKRYDLYLCGGEYGIGSGRFNKNIWRYSLISKKWILETAMPVERRHMITVFLKDKLLLVGGVGRYRQKLQTIDIYDIYTGMWTSSSAKMSLQFTSVPEHFIFNDKLIVYQNLPTYYIYYPDEDVWKMKTSRDFITFSWRKIFDQAGIPILTLQPMSCYIDVVDQDEMVLKTVSETCNVEGCNNIIKSLLCWKYHDKKKRRGITECHFRILMPVRYDENFVLTPFFCDSNKPPAVLLCTECTNRQNYVGRRYITTKLHLHSIPIQDPRKFRSLFFTKKKSAGRFFNLLHPAHLHITNFDHI